MKRNLPIKPDCSFCIISYSTVMSNLAKYWINHLQLNPHPEGGFYKETYRSEHETGFDGFDGRRNLSTGIYFMLTQGNFSAFHRIKSDEMWHFYDGSSILIHVINDLGSLEVIKLGTNVENGEQPQAVVKAGCWFASCLEPDGKFALAGCTVAPGFDFQDFEMANRDELLKSYPKHKTIITQLTRT